MSVLVLGGSALVPSLLLLWYIYARDRNPEPRGLLLKTFLLGAAICAPVVPVAMGLESLGKGWEVGVWGTALVQAFLGAAIPEEGFKYLVLRRFVWSKPAFDEPLDGVVYGATASLGFATLENILYVGDGGLEVAVLRALTAVPQHAFTGIIMGAFLGRARFAQDATRRFGLLATALGAAILLHGAYDAVLMTHSGYALLALPVLLLEVRWGRGLYKQLQAEQLQAAGLGTVGVAEVAGEVRVSEPAQLAMGGPGSSSVASWEWSAGDVRLSSAPPPTPPQRTFGSWLKLVLGSVGLTACGLFWLVIAAALWLPSEGGEPLEATVQVMLVLMGALPTALCLLLFRSGLRGPFAPAGA
ncbi:PrsW family intramembrane metalloprotease [Archangium sp.]|uniref:PrsW family intramembrane metalloprotease n=1 Tax=Archangium sp. TaxID=1872627 RepID=UPI003899CA9A